MQSGRAYSSVAHEEQKRVHPTMEPTESKAGSPGEGPGEGNGVPDEGQAEGLPSEGPGPAEEKQGESAADTDIVFTDNGITIVPPPTAAAAATAAAGDDGSSSLKTRPNSGDVAKGKYSAGVKPSSPPKKNRAAAPAAAPVANLRRTPLQVKQPGDSPHANPLIDTWCLVAIFP